MKLKHAILAQMDRNALKSAIDDLEIDGVDRRSAGDMEATLSRAHRATPDLLLEYLGEKQVKSVCDMMDVMQKGRRQSLVKSLLKLRQDRRRKTAAKRVLRSSERSTVPKRHQESTAMFEADSITASTRDDPTPTRLPDPPPGMIRVTKTELVWPGKYNEDGTLREVPRAALPFQVIETIDESRATREHRKKKGATLFDVYEGKEGDTFREGWNNKLIWGDNLLVMGALLEKFAGKIDLIYIDPPFATGTDFSFTAPIGETGTQVFKEQSVLEEKAYRDTWGRGTASYYYSAA